MNGSKNAVQNYLKLVFQNVTWAGVGDSSGLLKSTIDGNLYLRACTDASTPDIETLGTECVYTGYAAKGIAVPRNTSNWTVSWNDTDNQAEVINALEQLFGERTDSGATETVKYIEIWLNNTSADIASRWGWIELTTPQAINEGSIPRFAAGKLKYKHK